MRVEGVVPPLVTPLDSKGRLDTDGVAKLVRHVLDGGAAGVFVLGSAGEFPMVAREDRANLIRAARDAVDARRCAARPPLLAGSSACATGETLQLIEEAREAGADAAVVLPPFYYKMRTPVLVQYFRRVIEGSALPIVIYENPHTTGNLLPVEELIRLGEHEKVCGLKDSSGDLSRFARLVAEFSEPVLQGDARMMLRAVVSGAAGIVPGIANLLPEKCVELFGLASAGMLNEARKVERDILAAREAIYPDGKWREGLKYALSLRGLIQPYCAEPHDELTGPEKELIRGRVAGENP